MRIPEGWEYVSNYCIRRGDFTIVRIGSADGWRYELWRLGEQLEVNLATAEEAREICKQHKLSESPTSSTAAAAVATSLAATSAIQR